MGYGTRILILWAAMLSQIALGAYITFRNAPLYGVYNVCGRAWPISPLVDQEIGRLTWIPSSMMSVVAGLVVLRLWIRETRSRDSVHAVRMPAYAARHSAR
jgi:putative membrane protein